MPPNPIDRSNPLPLWAQVEADLRRRIAEADFDDGVFPTDTELTAAYGVSRHTVRDAVGRLNQDGLLIRHRGRMTKLTRPEFEQNLGTLYSLFQSVESTGSVQTSEVLELAVVRDVDAAKHLALGGTADLVLLSRLRFADGEPLAIDRAWLPFAIAEPLLVVDWTHTALYAELASCGAPVPNQGWERLTPVVPSPDDGAKLGLEKDEAAFSLERLGKHGETVVEWRTTIIRGDRYRFVTDWSENTRSELRPRATT